MIAIIMLGTNPPRKEKITKLLNLGGEVSVNVVNHGDIYPKMNPISELMMVLINMFVNWILIWLTMKIDPESWNMLGSVKV